MSEHSSKMGSKKLGIHSKEIEDLISKAIQKVGGKKENDICRYLPASSGGYLHHFTLRKMKNEEPKQLSEMIEKFIIKTEKPATVKPKQRAPRGSRKKKDQIYLNRNAVDRLLHLARTVGDKEAISLLTRGRSLPSAKKELIASIRQNKVDVDLWNAYVEAINAHHSTQESINNLL